MVDCIAQNKSDLLRCPGPSFLRADTRSVEPLGDLSEGVSQLAVSVDLADDGQLGNFGEQPIAGPSEPVRHLPVHTEL